MSAFPTATSTVYYNEAGEPLGWSDESSFEPEYDDFDYDYDRDLDDEVDGEYDPDDAFVMLDEGDDGIIDLHYDPSTRTFRA